MKHAAAPARSGHDNDTIELVEAGARLRLNDHVIDERPWWTRLAARRRDDSVRFTPVPPRAGGPRDDVQFPCPSCGEPGRTDIHDRMSGRRYLSCSSCFKMWQVSTAPTIGPDASWLMK
jgi:hypothetical protein